MTAMLEIETKCNVGADARLSANADPSSTSSVADVLQAYLDAQAARLRRLDPLVRADIPDAVHQMRVTARRLRAVLLGFDHDFLAGRTARLRKDLGWLANELGRARDLEVLRTRITTTAGRDAAALTLVDTQLAEAHDRAHADAVVAMTSPRYVTLLDELSRFVAAPPWSELARRDAAPELRKGLHRLWRQLDRTARDLHDTDADERALGLHELRRTAKRLRYCAEAAEPALGSGAHELRERLSDLQDHLGRHHDAVLADRMIERLGESPRSAGIDHTRHRLATEAAEDDRRALHLVHKMRHSHDLRWLR